MEIINLKKENLDSINIVLQDCFGISTEYEEDKIHLGITDIVSYVSLLPLELKVQNKNIKIVGICALSTLSKFRGRGGHASKLIQKSLQWAKENMIDFVALYGDCNFYSKFGFKKIPNLYGKNNIMIYIVNEDFNLEDIFSKVWMDNVWGNMPKF